MPSAKPDVEVIVIGAGFSGIGAGIKLKEAGFSFLIIEKAHDLGGSWRDNVYPGVAVDIASFAYSYSFEQNPDWSRVYAPGHELQRYANHCVDKYGIRSRMRFNAEVSRAVYDDRARLWTVHLADGEAVTCRYVLAATGALTQPKRPQIDGLDSFQSKVMHPARWDRSHDLSGKRVAIIGTGASAIQLVPSIAAKVKKLDVYQRTATWILPKLDAEIPPSVRALFAAVPGSQRAVRGLTALMAEAVLVLGIVYNKQATFMSRALESHCLAHLRRQVSDPVLREKLTPKYAFGCKRPGFSSDYFLAFNRPNVELLVDPIARVTPTGIVASDGRERPVDTLITATGFKVFEKDNVPPFEVFGLENLELRDYWDRNRYQAYEGASVPRFPNFFLIWGPYAISGASWFSMIEAQVGHALRCLKEARKRRASRVEVKQEAHDAYFRDVLRRQRHTVFYNNDCSGSSSYYFDKHGDALFYRPSSGLEMWWRSRSFDLSHYAFS
ncbi:NAD(P)/FAD-dependent oxidoreductase [Sorangium sp. So ce726]|uniref:flavin-containing monooxygenase n=1 Tax=Sorangium sp. So ce726 TaxID=3133319 RepID=UPI003F5E09E7